MLHRLSLAAIATLIAAAIAVPAFANEPGMPRSERLFQRLDTNKDGKLAIEELRPKAERRFLRLDADGDGRVSTAELDSRLKQQMDRRRAVLISRLDRDGDGEMTTQEVDAYLVEIFTVADGDKDGAVTLVEAQAYHKARMMERRKGGGTATPPQP
jgi:Ca2+-binding EF-hand superfamily protein